jgi:predicted RNA-binding Zn-ribbon protein involved in translation (DUF1610 family)
MPSLGVWTTSHVAGVALIALAAVAVVLLLVHAAIRESGESVVPVSCPNCSSIAISRDSASPWIFVFAAALFFPIGLILFGLNRNVWCTSCGIRFKRPRT